MSLFDVVIMCTEDQHWRGLFEAAQGVEYSLRRLEKWESVRVGAQSIVFNAHRLPGNEELPSDAIIFNTEQVKEDWEEKGGLGEAYVTRLRRHTIWDYSATNIERLRRLGIEKTTHCRIGYYPPQPSLPEAEQDVDVLFYGSMNERRSMLAFDLMARGLRVETLFGVYGIERDKWIARSKVVLNAHFYEKPIFEIFRVSHLLANKKCVVTENGGCDSELEQLAQDTCVYKPYDDIAEECERLVKDGGARLTAAERGYQAFKRIDQVAEVKKALK